MDFELLRIITPYVLFGLGVFQAGTTFFCAYILRRMENLYKRIGEIDREHQLDQRKNYEKFVTAEIHYMAVGKIDGLIGEIFRELKNNNATLNQMIGELRAKEKHDK